MKQSPSIHISNGRLIDPANHVDAVTDIYASNGKVVATGDCPKDFIIEQHIDADGLIVCPGLIDLAVHLREPGQKHKATIASETLAAASSGITTLVCTPDTSPVIDSPAVWELIRHAAKASSQIRVLATGALTRGLDGEHLAEIMTLMKSGCVALSNGDQQLANSLVTRRVMDYATTFGFNIFIRAEDRHLKAGGCIHEGAISTRLGLPGIPTVAETLSVASHLALAAQTGTAIHFRGLSSSTACQQISTAQSHNQNVTADVAIHQLHLTDIDVDDFNSDCHVSPPLRTLSDRDGLRRALSNGTISCLCSDHQPHEADAKNRPFGETEPGISGLETLLPLSLKLVDDGVISMNSMIHALTAAPAGIINQPLGQLAPGAIADICIFDPEHIWQFETKNMLSAGHNNPFNGWEMKGKVTHTLFEGNLVYQANK